MLDFWDMTNYTPEHIGRNMCLYSLAYVPFICFVVTAIHYLDSLLLYLGTGWFARFMAISLLQLG